METNSLRLNRFPACALAFSQDNELLMLCDTNHVATLFTSRGNENDKETMPLVIREAISWNLPVLIYKIF